jgi:arsenate reductase
MGCHRSGGYVLKKVVFACVHNAGRSQMAAALFQKYADPARAFAISAGTHPAERVHPEVVEAMKELGMDLSSSRPQMLTPELAKDAFALITMGCGEQCPFIPGVRLEDWPFPDPKGQGLEQTRFIRNNIERRVMIFLEDEGLLRA